MMRALLPMFAALMLALAAWPANAQTPIQSRAWMIPLQQDGVDGEYGQQSQVSVTNLSARPAHVTFRFYNALGAPVPYQQFSANTYYFSGERVGVLLEAGQTKKIYTGGSGMRAVFQLILSDEPIVVSAYAKRFMVGGGSGNVPAVSLAFDCDGVHADTFACNQPLTAMLPPKPPDPSSNPSPNPNPTPTPGTPGQDFIPGDGPRLAPMTPAPPTPPPSPDRDRRDSVRPGDLTVGRDQGGAPPPQPTPRGRPQ